MKIQSRPSQEEVQKMLADGSLIKQFKNMIFKIAHEMKAKHPNEDFEELVSEGYFGIMNYVPKYDPKKSELSTWVQKSAWGQMKNFCINVKMHRDIATEKDSSVFFHMEQKNWLPNFLRELSEDAHLLATATLEAPGQLNDVIRQTAPKTSQKALRRYMKDVLKWDNIRINIAWKEVSACL